MMKKPPCIALLSLTIALIACDSGGGQGGSGGAATSRVNDAPVLPLPLDMRRSTDGAIAMQNLEASIQGAAEHYTRTGLSSVRSRLLELLSLRATMLGAYEDFATMDALTREGLDRRDRDAASLLERASYLSAVHRFAEAEALLAEAERGNAASDALEAARLTIGLATGDDPEALQGRAAARFGKTESYDAQVALAAMLSAGGQFTDADAEYREALADYRDSSAFVFAWNAFQRGVMWAESADRPELAQPLYAEAVRRLPGYAVATVHLAELEAGAGNEAAAIARLRTLVELGVEDPEPYGYLGELLAARGDRDDAEHAIAIARGRYERLLEAHPEAFADHGAEFFAGPGADPERALQLARFNLELRHTPRAYKVAIEAAVAAGDKAEHCALVTDARPLSEQHPVLAATLEALPCD